MRLITLVLVLVFVAGCGSPRIAKIRTAGVGDTVLDYTTQERLPNAFGGRDWFGRKRPTGRIIVTYLGLREGRAVFDRQTIRIQSNATTMNSTPVIIPRGSDTTYSGTVAGQPFHGKSRTTAAPILLPPTGSQTQIISSDLIRHFVDVLQDGQLIVQGRKIIIEDASATSVRYRIRKNK